MAYPRPAVETETDFDQDQLYSLLRIGILHHLILVIVLW